MLTSQSLAVSVLLLSVLLPATNLAHIFIECVKFYFYRYFFFRVRSVSFFLLIPARLLLQLMETVCEK